MIEAIGCNFLFLSTKCLHKFRSGIAISKVEADSLKVENQFRMFQMPMCKFNCKINHSVRYTTPISFIASLERPVFSTILLEIPTPLHKSLAKLLGLGWITILTTLRKVL